MEAIIVQRVSVFLLLLIAGLMVVIVSGSGSVAVPHSDKQTSAPVSVEDIVKAKSDSPKMAPDVVAYYFHTTYRCVSCKKIEAYSREAIESGFAERLESGALKFESVNIDDARNKHFVKDYQLYTKSLVICDMDNGKQVEWKNLDKVWQLIRNKEEFIKYVQDEINAYLKEG